MDIHDLSLFHRIVCSLLHVLPGRHPSPTRVLQHLPARRPYGSYGRAEAVRALTQAPSVCGPRSQCAGARALDVPVPPRQLYSDHPTQAPPAQERQVSTWAGRCSRRDGQEGKQCHVPTCTRSTNGCGSLGGWGGLSVAETEERRTAVAKDGAKRAVATRARRRCKALKVAGAPGRLE